MAIVASNSCSPKNVETIYIERKYLRGGVANVIGRSKNTYSLCRCAIVVRSYEVVDTEERRTIGCGFFHDSSRFRFREQWKEDDEAKNWSLI